MQINVITKYALVDIADVEKQLVSISQQGQ
jgi:hypothetical protein